MNTGVGGHFLLQGIFRTQESNLSLLHLLYWQVGSLPAGSLGKPKRFIILCLYFSPTPFFWCLCLLHRRLTFFVSWNQHYKSFPQVFKWYLNCYRYASFWRYDYIYTQTKKFGKLSSGHRTGKDQFSFQSQRKAMPKNVQTTAQLHSFHMLAR